MIDSLATIFGVCIALVAAVMGLAYPLFVQSINNFPGKYGQRAISERFENEILYKALKPMLGVCVIELVVFPFIILVCNSHFLNILLVTIQAICVFALCFDVIGTCSLLVIYGDPSRYLNWVKKKASPEDIFQILQILIVQGAKNKPNDGLYNDAMREFGRQIMEFQHKRVIEGNKSTGDAFFIYPSYIFQALLQIERRSSEPENVLLNKRAEIIEYLYNVTEDFPITDQVYNLVWLFVNRMVDAKYDDWTKKYWNVATQYYNFKLDHSDKKDEKEKFLEFHHMVGVLLFYQKRYDALHYAFTFTNSYPPKYPLVPSTFSQIFDFCENFPIDENPFYLANHYNMFKNFEGANTEYKIGVLRLKYIALLMVRLFSVNDYNITFSDPLASPEVGSNIDENEYKINRITAIIGHLKAIPDEAIETLELKPEWKQEAQELLERFIEKCEAENQDLSNKRNVSEEKREGIMQRLIKALNNNNPSLPLFEGEDKKGEDGDFFAELEAKLPDELILDNRSDLWSNLEESMIQGLHTQQRISYCSKILQNRAIKTYSVSYRDFGEALNRLCLTPDYALVAIGVSAHLYTEIPGFNVDEKGITSYSNANGKPIKVYDIPSYPEDTVLIMKDKDVPKFGYRKLKEDEYVKDGLSEIKTETGNETESHLYSNIGNIKADNPVLKVKQGFYIDIPEQLNYVCIRILYHLEPDVTVVSKVEPIKNHIL